MKKAEIKKGELYIAKVNNDLTTVRVDNIREAGGRTVYDVTNLNTKRKTLFRSAQKFRSKASGQKRSPAPKVEVTPEIVEAVTSGQPFCPNCESLNHSPLRRDAADRSRDTFLCDSCGMQFFRNDGVEELADRERRSFTAASQKQKGGLFKSLKANAEKALDLMTNHVIIIARAGTGKTTTLIEGLNYMLGLPTSITPSPKQKAIWDELVKSRGVEAICIVAFNKSIAKELQRKVPSGVSAMTMHSLGFRALTKTFTIDDVVGYRVSRIIGEVLGLTSNEMKKLRAEKPTFVKAVQSLVSLAKSSLLGMSDLGFDPDSITDGELEQLASHYEVDLNHSGEKIFQTVRLVLRRCLDVEKDRLVDYDDMIWLPIVLNLSLPSYDLLLVDEAQDLNPCQQELAYRVGRRLVFCGDDRQAIYGFAGADSRSLGRLEERLGETQHGVVVLPLNETRRCAKRIVADAKEIVPDYEALPEAPEGTVEFAKIDRYHTLVANGDLVLSRTNAMLIKECFSFIRKGRRAVILGRDFGAMLANTINNLMDGWAPSEEEPTEIVGLIARVEKWLAEETEKEKAKENPSDTRLVSLADRRDCIVNLTEGRSSLDEVLAYVDKIFEDNGEGRVTLSSIHKAKGLEANRVFLLQPRGAQVPHPNVKIAWQAEQEWNLRYVAITRAINELVYVND